MEKQNTHPYTLTWKKQDPAKYAFLDKESGSVNYEKMESI